ncbi:hypothetical protein DLAC_11631 [Tieghemostelium lacteum]|uniref:Uncharacterized protein n=1 Tax=Tieghemostelium lacteum TaxID=361077 RepID=A0A151ZG51_TIELA|nr:hypothetical protein DLAC_11631 [Tieghemostelium lacteum]|eukprot:KYQ92948.1 hypothetical protein DLAC_11631 [Tieghemostelium lacteum]
MQPCPNHEYYVKCNRIRRYEVLTDLDISPITSSCNQSCKDLMEKRYDDLIEYAQICKSYFKFHDFKGNYVEDNIGILVFKSYLEGGTDDKHNKWVEEYFSHYKKK